ncbi:hypothetical protein Tco_1249532 [Tanacetum coccineum]
MAVRTQPTLSPGMSARIAEAAVLSSSSFRKRYRSSYETPSPSSSPTLQCGRDIEREGQGLDDEGHGLDDDGHGLDDEGHSLDDEGRGLDDEGQGLDDEGQGLDDEGHGLDDEGQGLDEEGQGLEDEGPSMEEEETAHEGQQQAVLVIDIAVSEPLGLGYGAARQRAIESTEEITPSTYEPTLVTRVDPEDGRVYTDIPNYVPLAAPVQTPPSPEWSLGSLPVSPSSPVVSSPIASPVATLAATISVDKDQFLEVGAQLELHGSILHDHTQRLDALPPTLFEGYDRDLRELYTRSGAIRDEIFSQRYRFRSLEREQKRATRENHDLRRQLAEERRERLELTDHIARM